MNCRFLTASPSIMTLSPALPSIFVMVSIIMFLLCMLGNAEHLKVLLQYLQKGRHLHRASAHHVINLDHLVESFDLFAIIEVTQVPSNSFVYLLAGKLIPACRGLSCTGARTYRHDIFRVLSYLLCLFRLRLR